MAFKETSNRQSQYRDFRVNFIRFEPGGARIGVSIKEPTRYVESLLLSVAGSTSNWNTFYSDTSDANITGPLGQNGRGKEVSEYAPIHTDNPNYNFFSDPLLLGGEFVIALKQTVYFWIQIPVRISGSGEVLIGSNNDSILDGKRLKIGFGPTVPDNTALEDQEYLFYLPIFRVLASMENLDLFYYDCGECVFLSGDFNDTSENIFTFSEASSYYD